MNQGRDPAGRVDRAIAAAPPPQRGLKLLIVSDRTVVRESHERRLGAHAAGLRAVRSTSEAVAAVTSDSFDAAIIDAELPTDRADGTPDGFDLSLSLAAARPLMALIVVHPRPALAVMLRALHARVDDVLPARMSGPDLVQRLDGAIRRRRAWVGLISGRAATVPTRAEGAAPAPRAIVETAPTARRASSPGPLTPGSPPAADPAQQPGHNQPGPAQPDARGFSIIRLAEQLEDELDLEAALRMTLEWIHAQVGSTSAAVFLPSDSSDWTLGAYINASFPRDGAEAAFDALAEEIGPRVEEEGEFCWAIEPAGVAALAGAASQWVEGTQVAATPCWSGSRCRAVIAVFRDARRGFTEEQVAAVVAASRVFGRQLGTILRVHHRRRVSDYHGESGWSGLDAA